MLSPEVLAVLERCKATRERLGPVAPKPKRRERPMRGETTYRALDVEDVVTETDLALLFRIDGKTQWVPKSVIEEPEHVDVGDHDVEVSVAEWFLDKEGI